jgi:hypothetical protein
MSTTGVVVLVVVVILVILAIALLASSRARKRRSEQLQGRFGPEYDRAVEERGDRKAAESHLADVADRRDQLDIRELSDSERARYTSRWQEVQADFVDSPGAATHDADRLINEVMRDRGYPVDDFDTRSDMVAADHPEVVEHYRAAHSASDGNPTTEQQRRAFVHYRALFEQLVGTGSRGGPAPIGRHERDGVEGDRDDTRLGEGADARDDRQRSIDLTEGERTTAARGDGVRRDDTPPPVR